MSCGSVTDCVLILSCNCVIVAVLCDCLFSHVPVCCVNVLFSSCDSVLCDCCFRHVTVCCVTVLFPSCDSVLNDTIVSVV